jgi:two-component system, CAI-1 autoinducer sensor kinase/phosphatase CqsS
MPMLRRLFAHYQAYHQHSGLLLRYMSILGLVMLPLLYLMRYFKSSPTYDDLPMRLFAMAMLFGALLRPRWPRALQPYYLPYSYLAMIVCLPMFFVFTSLKNGGGTVAVANTFMAVFLLLLLADWRNMIVMLVAGFGAAALLYIATEPAPRLPADYIGRLPVLLGTVLGASLFKHALEQATAERVRQAYASLAGSIAHEMRNPLGRIRQNLESMQDALPPPTTTTEPQLLDAARADALYRHVAESEIAVRRGLQVIAMTLDEVGAKPIDSSSFSVLSAAAATRRALQEYAFQSDEEAAHVELHVASDFIFRGDETAYLFAVFNLLKNALYYLPAYPHARVTITVGDHEVKVHDNGPGIALEAQARLFQPFASAGKSGGTGLGLSYCRRVMRAFRGDIRCESVPGRFTEFAMHFPPVPAEELEAFQQAALGRASAAFGGKRVLLVDDDAAQRLTTRHKLQVLGAEIDQAADGQRALEALARQPYDMVLLDLNIPLLDGYAVARSVRQGEALLNRDVPIVAHTSEPAHIAALKARNAGMDGFVGKPSTQAQLVQALHEALERRGARRRPEERHALAGRRILVADDAPYNRKAVAGYLTHVGAIVGTATHGQAVLDHLQSPEAWDAVVLDINMPGMNGLEAAAAIRRLSAPMSAIPIVALTAHSDGDTVRAAQSAGVNAFITKPVDALLLYRTLQELIGSAEAPPRTLHATPGATAVGGDALLDTVRLESYRRIGLLDELLSDYVPDIAALAAKLQRHAAAEDFTACTEALHSLLGMSGEAGAQTLYQAVRAVYVPMVETRSWPAQPDWAARIAALAAQSQVALRAYGATRAGADLG